MRARFVLLPLMLALAGVPAAAQQPLGGPPLPLPPGYVEEPEEPPEDPLPPPPMEFPIIPPEPVVVAPDAVDLLKACKEAAFTDCFRMWQPPPPEPEPVLALPVPPSLSGPGAPSPPGAGEPPPPPLPPPHDPAKAAAAAAAAAADKATFDALARALKDSGLDGKVLLTNPSAAGPTLQRDSKPTPKPIPTRTKP